MRCSLISTKNMGEAERMKWDPSIGNTKQNITKPHIFGLGKSRVVAVGMEKAWPSQVPSHQGFSRIRRDLRGEIVTVMPERLIFAPVLPTP